MICPIGGFPTIQHNKLKDLTASLLTEVCHNVATEPHLQPLSGESTSMHSAITIEHAHVDIRANGLWSGTQDAYFDVRIFHSNAPSNAGFISSAFKKHEDSKEREYGQRIGEIENEVFTPLVFSTTGGIGREATIFYKRLADLISSKRDKPYSVIMGGWDGNFPLLLSAHRFQVSKEADCPLITQFGTLISCLPHPRDLSNYLTLLMLLRQIIYRIVHVHSRLY